MWARRTSQARNLQTTRFNLLLLEDGEYFLEDYSAFRYLEPLSSTHRKVQGRLKVCTRGLFFVPNDIILPITRFPFRWMPERPHVERLSGGKTQRCLAFRCNAVLEMRERGIDHPYVQRPTLEDDEETPAKFTFTLLYSTLENFIESVNKIYEVANLPRRSMNKVEEEKYLAPVLGPRLAVDFDPSLLVDFREQLLFSPGRAVTRIEPLLNHPGCLVLTNQRLYFEPAKLNNVVDPVLHWDYTDIEQLYKRRYLLRQTGLEIYLKGGQSFFFSFRTRRDRDSIYDLMVEQPTLARFERSALDEMMYKWQRRELSNFEYLMFLNNAAGRTRNDLTQYPVFPWILSDYTSESLDLTNPAVYRDLSKPVGALNEERLEFFRSRYEMMPRDEEGEGFPPPFLYGTHYSTPGYVLYYLVRMLPQYMLCLQNGKFDAPDRLFRSIQVTWEGCLNNHTDVKELIPEFFDETMSAEEWLTNHQQLDLGTTQSLERINDVELPKWANGSPADFVKKHREALESDYVSQHLHEWIDLIFGYKQQGEEAVSADNLFYYLSYEGAVDLETIDDPVGKCSLESQIQEFGQTPKLLFSTPHPAREENESHIQVATPDLIPSPRIRKPRMRDILRPPLQRTRRGRRAIELNQSSLDESSALDKKKLTIKIGMQRQYTLTCVQEPFLQVPRLIGEFAHDLLMKHGSGKPPKKWNWRSKLKHTESFSSNNWQWRESVRQPLHTGEITCSVLSKDDSTLFSTCKHSCFKVSSVTDGSTIRNINAKAALSCCDVSPDEKRLLVGCWDNRVYMYSLENGRVIDRVFAHSDGISAICVMHNRFLTSSWDSTIKLWSYTDKYLVASPIQTFLDCDEAVLSLDVSPGGKWGAAGARNGVVYLFNLRLATYHKEVMVSPDRRGDVASVCFAANSQTFVCMTLENELLQYNLDGEQLYRMEVNATGQVRCFESDGEYAVGGTTNGKIFFWKLNEPPGKEVVYEIPRAHETIICSLVVASNGSCVITGAIDGSVRVWRIQPKHRHKRKSTQKSISEYEALLARQHATHGTQPRALSFPTSYVALLEEAQGFLEG
ncbi:hypothetical protein Poli38472_005199 [Pythium oligandrum]|uniref:Protein FAN n=1 Tax=Pythium oligandrum TaxID=41045 RepID=A0A8K1FHC9_PYTOL|nr:hypothetical protein Poli38472_005199 [Pythium oligandrum]|eukprot:TMW62581.1 hypothetical protein Poli38472_005199 [Pythium oligandrum]